MVSWQPAFGRVMHDFSSRPYHADHMTQIVKLTPQLSGTKVTLALSNQFGTDALRFDRVKLARTPWFNQAKTLTQKHQTVITIPRKSQIWLDPVDFEIQAGVPVYVLVQSNWTQNYADFNAIVETTFTNAIYSPQTSHLPALPTGQNHPHGWYCVSGLAVWTESRPMIVELAGDSLMELGMIETPLIQKTLSDLPDQVVIVNSALGGNQLMSDAPESHVVFGNSLIDRIKIPRFEFHIDLTFVLVGINDIILSDIRPHSFIFGVETLNRIFLKQGTDWVMLSLLPVGKDYPNQDQINQIQRQINAYLTELPYSMAIASSVTQANVLTAVCDFGDHLHVNLSGGAIIADQLFEILRFKLSQHRFSKYPISY